MILLFLKKANKITIQIIRVLTGNIWIFAQTL